MLRDRIIHLFEYKDGKLVWKNPTSNRVKKGVHRHYDGRYRACISRKGERIHIGCFDTPEDAHKAYVKKAKELFGEFYYGGENR